ncbi:MAG TPA: response regulator, partial [Pseudobdellovibrionaceae bacterium]|nr:response regulator [Pseudobdellovibrionaceae bacterium]
MQLALQDFAVEVKNVPAGAEVLDVAKTFKPDIVFADVLLPKRSGYEVCADFRKHKDPGLAQVPVVLMWSGFMALDADRATKAGYSGKLEKPFDADTLRELIMALVPKAKTNPIADFLSFPNLPNFIEESSQPSEPVPMELPDSSDIPQSLQWKGNAPAEKLPHNLPKLPSQTPNSNPTKAATQPPGWGVNEDDEVITVIREMPLEQIHTDDHGDAEEEVSVIHLDTNIEAESFESEDFKESPIVVPKSSSEIEDSDDSEWKRQDLSKFKIDDEENLEDDFAQKFIIPENELNLNELQIQND